MVAIRRKLTKHFSFNLKFDNIFEAIVAIFEISSGEMWPDIMYTVVDARGFDANGIWQEPVQDSYPLVALCTYYGMVQLWWPKTQMN